MNSPMMIFTKNGAMAPYNEEIFKRGGWEMVNMPAPPPAVPVPNIPVADPPEKKPAKARKAASPE